jgi:hypothetical protein
MVEEFKNLKRVALNEARKLDSLYANKEEFSEGDLKKYDCIMHALKSQLTAEAMMEAEGYEDGGMSGARGRSMTTGRYISRESNNSFEDGFSQGYSAAMNQGGMKSDHMPVNDPYYPQNRRW